MPGGGVLNKVLRALAGSGERDAAEGALRQVARREAPLAVERQAAPDLAARGKGWWDAPARPALPPPPRRLALPAPPPGGTRVGNVGPKPRGGQWVPDKLISPTQKWSSSPEEMARASIPPGITFSSDPADIALRDWWHRALPKYIKNDFGTEADPLLGLAQQGLHPVTGMTPESWGKHADETLWEDNVGGILFPPNEKGGMPGAGDNMRGEFVAAMPWLTKMPVTDSLYHLDTRMGDVLGFSHVADEMRNALNFYGGALSDLAVRPESLQRMSFPQAAEHVGRINQRRAELMAQQQAELAANPAVHLVKEYPDSPQGMRWVELRQPNSDALAEGWHPDGPGFYDDNTGDYHAVHPDLQDALRYEGDQMGHCVGGYCDDVAAGHSRIFSLRDAKGAPHVTIETAPGRQWRDLEHAADEDIRFGDAWNHLHYGVDPARAARPARRPDGTVPTFEEYLAENHPDLLAEFNNPAPQNIIQIKGKQNRAPIEDYLPFVQDFVKTQGPWGRVGDLGNTQLVTLPDGRYITEAQAREGLTNYYRGQKPDPADWPVGHSPERMAEQTALRLIHKYDPGFWREELAPHFEGYAYGGGVEPHRDFARHPMAVF